ncbi:MAG: hypothetical protein H6748_13640 [Spirochaetaceae bacterium]|nr:hypothetical protein [Spirochaetaceae bacterium]
MQHAHDPRRQAPSPSRLLTALPAIAIAVLVGWLVAACDQGDTRWETATDAVGAAIGEDERFDLRWREYRDAVVSSLDVMRETLDTARVEANVVDRAQISRMAERVDTLRSDLVAEVDAASEGKHARRAALEAEFGALRGDVEALLVRLGHSPDEFRAWQDAD